MGPKQSLTIIIVKLLRTLKLHADFYLLCSYSSETINKVFPENMQLQYDILNTIHTRRLVNTNVEFPILLYMKILEYALCIKRVRNSQISISKMIKLLNNSYY